jgi:hypothetical protein
MRLQYGQNLLHYRIAESIGAGGIYFFVGTEQDT